ncbi:MAG: nitrophenyl compound nitroreductase subunit ArsF family protein [Candidatus Kapabacteria bacterium]|nr:nitrophenyl compound nitroreductase subunit ArsF family protein [Candidatus Kapabacteria bacterium]
MKILNCLLILSFCFIFTCYSVAKEEKLTVDVIYFHATSRCQACLTNEDFIKNTLNQSFKNELKIEKLHLSMYNFQLEENEKLAEFYKIETQTLIISKKIDGKVTQWKALDKIWEYNGDFDKFSKYVSEEINKYLSD